jgi:hypothetical protein
LKNSDRLRLIAAWLLLEDSFCRAPESDARMVFDHADDYLSGYERASHAKIEFWRAKIDDSDPSAIFADAVLSGWGMTADAYRRISPDIETLVRGIRRAQRLAKRLGF